MFQLRDISKSFGAVSALKDISTSIEQGEIVALVGPSGSGKTTLLKTLNAQILPSSGHIHIDGNLTDKVSSRKLKNIRSNIAYIPQDLGLVPNLKVFQNTFLGTIGKISVFKMLRYFLFPPADQMDKCFTLLDSVGIGEKLYHHTSTLSGGQQQRVAVARALFQEAHTILADEPVSAVDPARAKNLVTLLTTVAKENKLTLVMSIHNVELAKEFFPRIIGLKRGSILFDQTAPTTEQFEDLYSLNQSELSQ